MAPTQRTTMNRRIADLGTEVWRILASRRLTIIVLVVALTASIVGILSPFEAPSVGAQAPGYRGVGPAPPLWGTGTSLASRLAGVGLGVLAALSLVRLLQVWVTGWGAAAPREAEVRLHEVPWGIEEAWGQAGSALAVAGLRLERGSSRGDTWLGLARSAGLPGRLGGAFYLGVLLILAAGLVAHWWGWAGEPVELALGETRALGPDGDPTVRLEQIEVVPGADGTVAGLTSTLAAVEGDGGADSVRVSMGRRSRLADLALYQLGYGPAVRVVARDTGGNALRLQPMVLDPEPRTVARVSFSGRQQEHLLAVPQANMVVRLVHYPSLTARGIPGPVLHVRVERGIDGLSLAEEFLTEGRQLWVGDVTLDIGFEYYVVIRAAREPHLPLAALGAALIVLGVIGFVAWPERRAWVAIQAREGADERRPFADERRLFAATLCQLAVEPQEASADWLAGVEAVLVERACGWRDDVGT
jgi:hypothetical protein